MDSVCLENITKHCGTNRAMKKIQVETVELTKKVYIVEVEDDGEDVWACDTVVCNEVEPVSSVYLDFAIFGYRRIDNESED